MGKSTISMVIFHSYFDITRGYPQGIPPKNRSMIGPQDFLQTLDGAEMPSLKESIAEEPLPPLPPPKDSRDEAPPMVDQWIRNNLSGKPRNDIKD
jgi:hypothetical protein